MNYNTHETTCLNWAPPSFARCLARFCIMTTWLPIFIAIYGLALVGVYIVGALSKVIIQNKWLVLAMVWSVFTFQAIIEPSLWAPTECLEGQAPNVTGYMNIVSMPAVMMLYNDTQRYNIM